MWGGASQQQPPQRYPHQMQVQPFGGGGPFGGRDPFGEIDDMMASPFGAFGGGRGGGGGGLFGGLFGEMGRMMQDADNMMRGQGGAMQGMAGDGRGGGMMMASSSGGGGGYSMQTMMFSSSMGQDGNMHTERFSSSSVGNMNGQMREVQQAYSNSSTGMNKMSLERQLEGRGRKMVKEHHAHTGEERHTDMYKGMSEADYPAFERSWQARAVPQLPAHHTGMQQHMLGNGGYQRTMSQPQAINQQQTVPAIQYQQPATSSWWR